MSHRGLEHGDGREPLLSASGTSSSPPERARLGPPPRIGLTKLDQGVGAHPASGAYHDMHGYVGVGRGLLNESYHGAWSDGSAGRAKIAPG
jgi:hypothetical protein